MKRVMMVRYLGISILVGNPKLVGPGIESSTFGISDVSNIHIDINTILIGLLKNPSPSVACCSQHLYHTVRMVLAEQ